jgi:tetraacyldisaccharide 4'-kinase
MRGNASALARAMGDEAALVAERVPEAVVVVGPAKQRAVRMAVDAGAEVVVVDDAFQSWALARDLDVVLLDAVRPIGAGRLLPAGTLRERPAALCRADVVVFNGVDSLDQLAELSRQVKRWLRDDARVLGLRRVLDMGNTSALDGPVFVVAGIARPERLVADIAARGIGVCGVRRVSDHHRYQPDDVRAIEQAAAASGAAAVVTTEKDWVKLRDFDWRMPVVVARLRVELLGGELLVPGG